MHAQIEKGLCRPWYCLSLPIELEAKYRMETSRQGGSYVRSWLGVFILFNILSLPMDYDAFGPEAALVPFLLTLGVFCPIACAAIVFLRGHPTVLRQSLAALGVVLVDIAIVLNSARLVPALRSDGYVIIAAIVPLVCGLIAPLPFRHSLWFCGTSLALYVGLVVGFGLTEASGSGLPLLVSCLILVPLKVSYSREWEAKQRFLVVQREKMQAGALAQANMRLTTLAQTDGLTALANRRHFTEQLENAWSEAKERQEWLGVILVDIDHFKLLNDTAGHAEGDRCLVLVAEALREALAPYGGLVARHGGEEFAAFLPLATIEVAHSAGEAIRAAVATLGLQHPGFRNGTRISVSVGTTAILGHSQRQQPEAFQLLKTADLALYSAKKSGRDRVKSLSTATNTSRIAIAVVSYRGVGDS